MAHNPVQIVLNDTNFIKAPDSGRMGYPKEFFGGRDEAFVAHKQKILSQAKSLKETIETSSYGPSVYASVKLRDEALAKSYRPTRALFNPNFFPCAGVGRLGEMFYLVNSEHVSHLLDKISCAEEHSTLRESRGKRIFTPSNERSETGAIDYIDLLQAEDKVNFSLKDSIDWFNDPGVAGGYLVELFEMPDSLHESLGRKELLESLKNLIVSFGLGVRADLLRPFGKSSLIDFKLTSSTQPAQIRDLTSETYFNEQDVLPLSTNYELHQNALMQIAQHPLVRKVSLPPKIMLSNTEAIISSQMGEATLTEKIDGRSYPKVGVIDTGVSSALDRWMLHKHDYLDDDNLDKKHGTFIGGLLVDAQNLNDQNIGREDNGCYIYDIPLFPKEKFSSVYKTGFRDFLEEVEQAVSEAKELHGVKVFNLSINATSAVEADEYSYYASRLDEISEKYGVIFVNSVGNLPSTSPRTPWPKKTAKVIEYFAARTESDTIFKPSESSANLSVGAINPPHSDDHLEGAPTTYTRRGPGLRVGNKPDVAHFGGTQPCGPTNQCGLISISPEGNLVSGCGTSYAAPMVSKTLAALDEKIENEVPTHVLRALTIHHSEMPSCLSKPRLKELSRQFVGFGVPTASEEMLITDDHSITMVFDSLLDMGQTRGGTAKPRILRFPFSWPRSLVDPHTGACFGAAKMTLVYLPPLDRRYGAEFVRINVDAKLQQRQPQDTQEGKPSFRSVIDQCYLPKTAGQPAYEKELIKQGLKWWPTKKYIKQIGNAGLGKSSEWRLEVECSMRAEADFPTDGVPFALIVTISDPEGQKPIFQELRRDLQAKSVNMADIRTSTRVRSQV